MKEMLLNFVAQYGYAGLFGLLAISIFGPPVPDEFLMTFAGFLSHTGTIHPVLAIISAASGSITGITATYFIGRFLRDKVWPHLERHAGAELLEKALRWYQWNGGILLSIGYFIPGVRHLTGYIAGVSGLSYRRFAMFAYLGAVMWASTFVTLGRVLGSSWQALLPVIHKYVFVLGSILAVLIILSLFIYRQRKNLKDWLKKLLEH